MYYSFKCPFPCNQEITVDAVSPDDAITRMIQEGAMRCRNKDYHCYCDEAHLHMPPINKNELKNIVQLYLSEG